jgi:hypothetical protein
LARKGENRANPFVGYGIFLERLKAFVSDQGYSPSGPCVFISHQREDSEACEPIASYLIDAGLDVYFDNYDRTLSELVQQGSPDGVTERIKKGIDLSSHMLCVVSVRTVSSFWVPFEVGYGYGKLRLGVLTLKGIPDESLPDYMKTTQVIRGTRSLNEFIAELLGKAPGELMQEKAIKAYSERNHPLDDVLDWRL